MQSSISFAQRQGRARSGTAKFLCRLWQVMAARTQTCNADEPAAGDRTVTSSVGRWCIADVVRIRTGETGAAGERMAGGMADRMDSDDES